MEKKYSKLLRRELTLIEIENTEDGKTKITLTDNSFIEKLFNRYGLSFKKMKKIRYDGDINIDSILNNAIAMQMVDRIMNSKLEQFLSECEIKGFDENDKKSDDDTN